jgi:hypothetical protein
MNQEYRIQQKRYVEDTKQILYAGLIAVALMYFCLSRPSFPMRYSYTWTYLIAAYSLAFYVGISLLSGWRLLNRMTVNTFLYLPIVGWVIYFFLKIALALFIGGSCFYAVFRLANNLYQIVQLQIMMSKQQEE